MSKRRTLQELTIRDNFMFAAVMTEPENCRGFLEMALKLSIDRIEVDAEKSMIYHPEYHGIRLDVLAKDDSKTRYSVEMQVASTPVYKRSRYYHSQIDMDLLLTGSSYEQLPEVYVIFICDYDPFGDEKYIYTVNHLLQETGKEYQDGSHTMFLSTCGTNDEETDPALAAFLHYVHASLEDSSGDFRDPFVEQLQDSVRKIKSSREMEARFMVLEEMLRQERAAGYDDGMFAGIEQGIEQGIEKGALQNQLENLLEILSEFGKIPEGLMVFLTSQTDVETLKEYCRVARHADSLETFEKSVRRNCSVKTSSI